MTTECGKSSQLLEAEVKLSITNSLPGHMGSQTPRFPPVSQEWAHQFPLQRQVFTATILA